MLSRQPITLVKITKRNNIPEIKKKDLMENVLKIGSFLITVASVFIGIWEFNSQQATNDALEFKRKIWEKRLNAYIELSSIISQITTETNDSLLSVEAKKLDLLYWGKLPLFDDDNVEAAVKNFRNKVKDKQDGIEDIYNHNALKISGYEAIKECRTSITNSWEKLDK